MLGGAWWHCSLQGQTRDLHKPNSRTSKSALYGLDGSVALAVCSEDRNEAPRGSASEQSPLPGPQPATFSVFSHGREQGGGGVGDLLLPLPGQEGPTLTTSFNANYLLTALSLNIVSWESGSQHRNWGGGTQFRP